MPASELARGGQGRLGQGCLGQGCLKQGCLKQSAGSWHVEPSDRRSLSTGFDRASEMFGYGAVAKDPYYLQN